MKQNKNIMNWLSFEVKGMYSYCMHKINILIHVVTKWYNFHNRITFRGSSKKTMLVELCAKNYATHDGFVIFANGIFQRSTKVLILLMVINMVWHIQHFLALILIFKTFFNLCKWILKKLIQVLQWKCANCKPLYNGIYLSPNHIHFVIHMD